MSATVYIIGVDHIIQHLNQEASPAKVELVAEFARHLKEAVKLHSVTLIAEEFSEEALTISNATTSTAQNVANELNVQHRFCDPSSEQRAQLVILKNDIDKREQCWLDCIRSNRHPRILFICGNKHVETFAARLSKEGFQVHVYSKDWGLNFRG